jgi:hypothetical protein
MEVIAWTQMVFRYLQLQLDRKRFFWTSWAAFASASPYPRLVPVYSGENQTNGWSWVQFQETPPSVDESGGVLVIVQ